MVRARLAALVDNRSALDPLSRAEALCRLCQKTTVASGAALSVAGPGLPPVISSVCGTDALSMRLEELQLELGEGPIADALQSTFPVLESDLTDVSHLRWLWFARAAVEAGAGAVFVLPLGVGERPVGALSVYRSSSGDLTAAQFDDFRVFADAAAEILLPTSADAGDEPASWAVAAGTGFQPEIHQAIGLVMAALEVDAASALARLRGHAFAAGQPISAAAHAIVTRRLRLESDAT